jgi:1,4-alpha-glucan branching enzyme
MVYMFAHPGKKLTFMGSEFAQFDEWNFESAVQFQLLSYAQHLKTQEFSKALNRFYAKSPELYEIDFNWQGFRWLQVDDKASNILAWNRRAKNGSEVICVFNFSLAERKGYRLNAPPGLYEEAFATARAEYGGTEYRNPKMRTETDGGGTSFIKVNLAPLSAIIIKKTLNEWTI